MVHGDPRRTTVIPPSREGGVITPRPPASAPAALRPLPQALPPRPGDVLGTWTVEATPDLRGLRAGLHAALRAHRAVTAPVVLVASELTTNALRHGAPPATVTLSRTGAGYLLDVADGAVDALPALAERRPLGQGGFGLYVVGRMADAVGWFAEHDRKHVWALFGL